MIALEFVRSKGGESVKTTVEAVFEDGVLKPVQRPEVREGERVQLTVERVGRPGAEDPLEMAARVYQGLRPEEVNEIERIALDRTGLSNSSRS